MSLNKETEIISKIKIKKKLNFWNGWQKIYSKENTLLCKDH